MTDQDILARIEDGSLVVDTQTAVVLSYGFPIFIREHESNGSRYRFVEITRNGKKKKIALHRLVWIAANRRLPPDGYDVDHVRGKRVERPDAIDNLQLLESSRNRSLGAPSPNQLELPF